MNNQPEHPLYQRLRAQLQQVIEPHQEITDGKTRNIVSILSLMTLMCLPAILFAIIIQPGINPKFISQARLMSVINLIWVSGIYILLRTRYAERVINLTIILAMIAIFAYPVFVDPTRSTFMMGFLIIVTLAASLLKSLRIAVFVALAGIAGILLFFLFVDNMMDIQITLIFNVIANGLILIVAYLRQQDGRRITQSEQRLRSLMEANLEVIVFFDKSGNILDVNQAFSNITGFQSDDVVSTPVVNLLAQRSRPDALRRWNDNNTIPFRAVVRHKDGTHLHMEVQILNRNYDTQAAYVVVGRDITEQIQTERHGKEQEHSYQSLFTSTSDGVFIMDLDGTYLNANERAGHMLGCSVEGIIGESVEKFIPEDEKALVFQSLRRILKGEKLPVYERHFQRKDGTGFPAEVSVMMVYNADNDPLHVQSLVRDISQREEVTARKLDLALQTERTHILRDFINDASHHFRTPLANIKTGVYLLSKIKQNPQKHEQQLEMMQAQVNRMENLINDLLTMIRLEDIDNSLRREIIPVNHLLNRLMDTVHARHWHEHHHWELTLYEDDQCITADGNQLMEVFLRLMQNSMAHTSSGGTIQIRAEKEQQDVIISIIDNGAGIAEAELEHIFKNFYQTDASLSHDTSSNGMGLPISQKIIQLHGGTIDVSSIPGVETMFRVKIPMAQSDAPVLPFIMEADGNPEQIEPI